MISYPSYSFDSHMKEYQVLESLNRSWGIDPRNTQKNIDEHLLTGKEPKPRLQNYLFSIDTQTRLSDECVRLHAFAPWFLSWYFEIAKKEKQIPAKIKDCQNQESVFREFRNGIVQLDYGAKSTLEWLSFKVLDQVEVDSNVEFEDNNSTCTEVYRAGRLLHSYVKIFDEAAMQLKKLAVKDNELCDFLEFNFLEICGVQSIADVICLTSRAYQHTRNSLERISNGSNGEDDDDALLAEHANRYIMLNQAGLSDFAIHIGRRDLKFCGRGELVSEIKEKLESIPRVSVRFEDASSMLQDHPKNLLIARNYLYYALRDDNLVITLFVSSHIAEQLGISVDEVWSHKICKADPLNDPLSFISHKFDLDGIPFILREARQ